MACGNLLIVCSFTLWFCTACSAVAISEFRFDCLAVADCICDFKTFHDFFAKPVHMFFGASWQSIQLDQVLRRFASAKCVTKRRATKVRIRSAWCYIWRHRSSRKQCFILNAWRRHFHSFHFLHLTRFAELRRYTWDQHYINEVRALSSSRGKAYLQHEALADRNLLTGREMPRRQNLGEWKWSDVNFGTSLTSSPSLFLQERIETVGHWDGESKERAGKIWMCNCSDNRIERASMPVRLNPSTSSANFTTVLDAEKSKTAVYGEINVKSVFRSF